MGIKRGVFFSTDALIALGLILFVIIIAYPLTRQSNFDTSIHYDTLSALNTLKTSEVQDPTIQSLIITGQLNETNNSLLESIGELYITDISSARQITESFLQQVDTKQNIGIWFDTTLVASKNNTPFENAKEIKTTRQIISGIKQGENIVGISARALLSSASQTKYTYFGGYVGDGNLTFTTDFTGDPSSAEIEIAINKDFKLYINDIFQGNYQKSSSDTVPATYSINSSSLHSGLNRIKISADNAYIAGGFFKVYYESDLQYPSTAKYYFPGIEGLINLYDGFYVPGQLQNLSIFLHFNSSQTTFLNIGNTTVYGTQGFGETSLTLTNSQLASLLDYSQLSNKTTPIRFGLQNVSLIQNGTSNADIILITDLSGSMNWRLDSDSNGITRSNCSDSQIYSPSTSRISLAKCLDKNFTSSVLASGNNRIGLVGFSDDANNYIDLTSDAQLLTSEIDSYTTSGATCVSCAINRAYLMLQSQGTPDRPKYIVVMTDGVANVRSTSTCSDIYGASSDQAVGNSGMIIQKTSSWNSISSPTTSTLNDIDLNGTFGLTVGNNGRLMRWNNTWGLVTSPVSSTLNAIDAYNSTLALGVGSSGRIIKLSGTTWSLITTITNSPTLYDVQMVNSTLAYVVGYRTVLGSEQGKIYRTTNAGNSWTEVYSGSERLRSIRLNSTFGFAVGNNGLIVRWNGASWTEVASPTTEDLYKIEKNGNQFIAVGGDNGNSIILTYGSSWSLTESDQGDSLRDISFYGGKIYALGEGGTLYENSGTWQKKFDIVPAYEGSSTSGITCTTDQDSCSESNSYPSLNANYSSCKAHQDLGATVYSIGFGPIASCGFATQTLQAVASCGNGSFYSSNNATLLNQFYTSIAQEIVELSYSEQTSVLQGNLTTKLYPDSYIEYQYIASQVPYGLVITREKNFDSAGNLIYIPESSEQLYEAIVTSYSGPKWTKLVKANTNAVYNLSIFGIDYSKLGDPFVINVPKQFLANTTTLSIKIGSGPGNESSGSSSNKLIYTTIRNASSYSPIVATSDGCIWNIDFDDGTNATLKIPSGYNNSASCFYTEASQSYNSNDAAQSAAWLLLRALDADNNNRVDARFNPNNVAINLTTIQGIPFAWSTEVQVRVWR